MKIIVDVDDELYARAREFAAPSASDTDLLSEALRESVEVDGSQPEQHELVPACTGGHFTVPNEQNTQQSPCSGLRIALQFSQ